MQKKIEQIIETSPYKIHVIVEDYKTGSIPIFTRAHEVFSSASVIKVPILMAVLHQLQQTDGDLQQIISIKPENVVDFSVLTERGQGTVTLHELLLWMIITSDNTATNECIDILGMDALNCYFKKFGLKNTVIQRKMMDFTRQQQGFDNETTAEDMRHLFKQIFEGTLLNSKWNAEALNILCRQRCHESLKRYIVDDIKIAHKTGGLDTVDHDAGIIFTDNGDYFIGVFITEVVDNEQAKRMIGTISKIVYDQFTKN